MGGNKGSWGKTQEALENSGGGTFLRLENDGDSAVVAFCGAPMPREICFNEKTKNYEPWDDTQKAAGRKKQTKYLMNVYAFSSLGKPVNEIKIIDMNFNTMTAVIALKDKYGLSKCAFEIKRHGAKGDTKTQYAILPEKDDLTAEQRAIFGTPDPKDPDGWIEGSMKLLDLEEHGKGVDDESTAVTDDVKGKGGADKKKASTNGTAAAAAPAPAASAHAGGGTELISKAAASGIIENLKPLDREKGIGPFLAKFPYAKKVSEVRASDELAALAFATELAGGGKPAQEDPFA